MPIQLQDIHDQEDSVDCPLCLETLEVDDINFFPCQCGYQICRFCWHRIRTDENGLCPACRKAYPENPAEFKPLSEAELQKIRLDKKQKEAARRQKITDSRKHLANVRVLQKNLVFVVGLSQRLAEVEVLKRQEYFGKYGKILKVVLNSNTSYAGTQAPSCSAYVTYSKVEESLRAIQSVNNVHIDGRTLKASLGTTKYCSNYLKNQVCQKHDCMYLHEIGDEDASFTKEDMQMAKHQEYEQKLIQQMIQKEMSQAQELKNKAMRQESSENGGTSAGSSPPTATSTITQGLSVAQAVKKNTKMATERPRRHSSSTPASNNTETTDTDFQNKNSGKGPRLSTSVGDRDSKAGSKPNSRRNAGKKNVNAQNGSQAPRHKKQQQQQASANSNKKVPSRAHSASPSTQNSQSGQAIEHSPPSSMPVSTGPSVESSPAVTPLRDVTTESNQSVMSSNNKNTTTVNETTNKMALRFSEESSIAMGETPTSSTSVTATLPIDIPHGSEGDMDKNRDTPLSDTSSIDRKSPFVRDNLSQDSQSSLNNQLNSGDGSLGNRNVLTQSRFMMMHKETSGGNDPFSRLISNNLGYSPFGMASNPSDPSTLLTQQALPTADKGLPTAQPTSHSMPPPPPGLTGIQPSNNNMSGGWPSSNPHLSDSMPIKSSNDWEAAFGFKSTPREVVPSADDDLGFDPWAECSKGFADLMEKEKTQEAVHNNNIPYSTNNFPINSNSTYSELSAAQRRPTSIHNSNHLGGPQMGFHGGTDLINGFSNLLSNQSSQPPQQHKMPPFPYDNLQQRQFEQSRFAQQQKLPSPFQQSESSDKSMHQFLGSANFQKPGLMGPPTPNKDQANKNSTNIANWQNELRALLPSVNINFANQGQIQRPTSRPVDSTSLGLSGLGMPMEPNKQSNIPHPPGISNSSINSHPHFNKSNIMPPPGVGFPGRPSSMMPMRQQWGGPESSMSTPGMPSNRLVSPASLQSLFAGGSRSESTPMPGGTMPSYPPDPAIIQGGMPGFGPSMRRNRLFENPQKSPSNNEDQPHWMKSLQALTEPDSPVHPIPSSNNNSNMNQLFSQRPTNNGMPSWPGMPGLFSNPGFGPAQPPPGFQVRPSLSKPTEFGMIHSLLENQS